jgi:hypothetical protein
MPGSQQSTPLQRWVGALRDVACGGGGGGKWWPERHGPLCRASDGTTWPINAALLAAVVGLRRTPANCGRGTWAGALLCGATARTQPPRARQVCGTPQMSNNSQRPHQLLASVLASVQVRKKQCTPSFPLNCAICMHRFTCPIMNASTNKRAGAPVAQQLHLGRAGAAARRPAGLVSGVGQQRVPSLGSTGNRQGIELGWSTCLLPAGECFYNN